MSLAGDRPPPAPRSTRSALAALAIALIAASLSWTDAFVIDAVDAETIRPITLPIHADYIDQMRWRDTWGAPRSGGRSHIGVDMLGPKMVPVVAARSGRITWGRYDNGRGSIVRITDDDGWQYTYVHMNNDTPGTDDGRASCTQVFSARLCAHIDTRGRFTTDLPVTEGEVLGYMGDSGNAEWTSPHLHFEIAAPDGNGGVVAVNPTPYVDAALVALQSGVGPLDPPPPARPGDEGFANHLWFRVYGRYPSRTEAATFAASVEADGLWSAVAAEVGDGSTAAMVDRLYLAFFRRYPDTAGIEYWLGVRARGSSMEDIADWFAQSEEFQSRYGGTTFDQFLDLLYVEVLGRAPDEAGKAYWLDLLERGEVTRGAIVVHFTESSEMKGVTGHRGEIVAVSLVADGRVPSAIDAEAWSALRSSRERSDALADWFAAS